MLLSPSLTRLGYITVPGHGLSGPCALHLDLLTHRLYIGDSTVTAQVSSTGVFTGRVFVLGVDDS